MNVNTEQFEILAQMAAAYGIKQWVLSPGSRCAPITLALVRCPDTQTRSVSDERSAAYIALGMAEALGEPVGLLCTSGTAALNYAPAIAEAFYKKVPLFVLTADRPPEWLNQQDGQAIPQQNIYGRTVKGSFELPVSQAHTDERHYFVRILSEAMNLCLAGPGGPVHVNVPVREPFYPEPSYKMRFDRPVKMIRENRFIPKVDKFLMNELANQWLSTEKKLMVAGQHLPDLDLRNAVHACRTYNSVPVVADITANLSTVENLVTRHDLFLQPADAGAFQPDLLVTFGDTLLSKNLKGFLRKYPAKEHWHIQAGGDVPDTFHSLTRIIRARPVDFLTVLGEQGFFSMREEESPFTQTWLNADNSAQKYIAQSFAKTSETQFNAAPELQLSEFEALNLVMNALPEGCNLHLANSMPVRYANYLQPCPEKHIAVFGNRGTGGIDGCTSTAVGHALFREGLHVLLTGDMAFFYDQNGLWNNFLPKNLRIVVFNNHGGGIFRMIEGPASQPELVKYFETEQHRKAERCALDAGMDYTFCHNQAELRAALPAFLAETGKAALLELETDAEYNTAFFREFKSGYPKQQ